MNLLFIGYWNADDPLTASTILPHLKLLKQYDKISNIVFTSVQREDHSESVENEIRSLGVVFRPIYSRKLSINILNKFYDFISLPKDLIKIVREHQISEVIARGALAGSLALNIYEKINIPFSIESLEPHADYMRSTGVWKPWDPRYLMQKHWEKRALSKAKFLFPVTRNYKNFLVQRGIDPSKIHISPCAVNSDTFFVDRNENPTLKSQLGIENESIVGVYAGKFGGLYYKNDAFRLFKMIFEIFPKFHLILLSPEHNDIIVKYLNKVDIDPHKVSHKFAAHNEVVKYLNMADFAIATFKTTQYSKYLSPVKVAEYWACGLPVLISKDVGDEQYFIEKEDLGLTIDVLNVYRTKECLRRLKSSLPHFSRSKIREKGLKLRNFRIIDQGYAKLFS